MTRPYWIHGVSAGEVKVAKALIKSLIAADPDRGVVLSSSTASGLSAAMADDVAKAILMPLDLRPLMARTISCVDPACIILIEAELWPQLLHTAKRHHIPVIVVSGKISDRTNRRLSTFRPIANEILPFVTHYFVQDSRTEGRLRAFGVAPTQITVAGNFKLTPPDNLTVRSRTSSPGPSMRMLVFGNVHPDEAQVMATIAERVSAEYPFLTVLLVPRHPDKFDERSVKSLFARQIQFLTGEAYNLYGGEIVWLNQMGVLASIYGMAEIAVVGGTFCDVGGHDLVEPLHRGALTIYGPNISSQRSLHDWLNGKPYAFQVHNVEELSQTLSRLLRSPSELATLREQALRDLAEFRSQSEKIAATVAKMARHEVRYPHRIE
ncbi:3-deoxy-D-manno-octulosonic acid transferase [Rhizobium leguminosarum]|uniref:3-deoxy-D-manno-octulosonic acid transferase n=1 Tax=Rhizobium leguminosarum TaxID=384 RepID=UPI0013F16F21|nr:glycosyltransferase N-terminal domain-containing protein [Rhizobium leguminosarum]